MTDYINRDALSELVGEPIEVFLGRLDLNLPPTVDAVPVVRCKDCKHRPKQIGEGTQGFNLEFPDWKCPCQCDDGWYNWMPEDDWYCGNGERKEE